MKRIQYLEIVQKDSYIGTMRCIREAYNFGDSSINETAGAPQDIIALPGVTLCEKHHFLYAPSPSRTEYMKVRRIHILFDFKSA